MRLKFHIIYTKGSVQGLLIYFYSLLKYTSFEYCLVSNGCSEDENILLRKQCENTYGRVTVNILPTSTIWPHGKALNYLHANATEAYFCFMDSDVFAVDFINEFTEKDLLAEISAIYSCTPIWVKEYETVFQRCFKEMSGTFNSCWNGRCIGSTYFAIYNNSDLIELFKNFQVGFDDYLFEELPINIQLLLKNEQLNIRLFDTGKIVNILLFSMNKKLLNLKLPKLCHIGGVSFEVIKKSSQNILRNTEMSFSYIQSLKLEINQFRIRMRFLKRYKNWNEFTINVNQRLVNRDPIRGYFFDLGIALINNTKLPKEIKIKDHEIRNKFLLAREQFIDMYKNEIDVKLSFK